MADDKKIGAQILVDELTDLGVKYVFGYPGGANLPIYDVINKSKIEVVLNGVLQNAVTGCSLQAGKIGFQFEGAPFELRHVTMVALD